MNWQGYGVKDGGLISKGPCVVCGMENYSLSMGGPQICPACDCGIPVTDSRHPKAQLELGRMPMIEIAGPPKAIRFNPDYVGTGRIIMQTESEAITEQLSDWMKEHGLETGTGNFTVPELLKELHWQFEQPRLDRNLMIEALKVIKDVAQLQSGVRWQMVQDACERVLESVTRPHPSWTPHLKVRKPLTAAQAGQPPSIQTPHMPTQE